MAPWLSWPPRDKQLQLTPCAQRRDWSDVESLPWPHLREWIITRHPNCSRDSGFSPACLPGAQLPQVISECLLWAGESEVNFWAEASLCRRWPMRSMDQINSLIHTAGESASWKGFLQEQSNSIARKEKYQLRHLKSHEYSQQHAMLENPQQLLTPRGYSQSPAALPLLRVQTLFAGR